MPSFHECYRMAKLLASSSELHTEVGVKYVCEHLRNAWWVASLPSKPLTLDVLVNSAKTKKLVRPVGTQRVWTDVQFSFCRIAFVKCKVLQIRSMFGNLSSFGGFNAPWRNIQSMLSQCVEQWNPFFPEGTPPLKREGESMVSPFAGDMKPPWGPFFPQGTPPVKRYSLLIEKSALIFLNIFTMGAMAGGGESWGHVLLVSP